MGEPSTQRRAEPIELIDVSVRLEVRVLLGRDQERRAGQVELTLVTRDESAQGAPRFGRVGQCASYVLLLVLSLEPADVVLPVGVAGVELPVEVEPLVPKLLVPDVPPLNDDVLLLKPPYVVS